MERLKRQLSGQLSARLMQGRDELRQAVERSREQQRVARRIQSDATRHVQLDVTRAVQRSLLEARRAIERQRMELDKAREMMLRKAEMD